MNVRKNIRIGIRFLAGFLGMAWLLWHFFATFVLLVPTNAIARRYESSVTRYMVPLFTQNWHLFSPNPGFTDQSLWIRCYGKDGGVSEWMDPIKDIVDRHHKTRLSGEGKLLYIYNSFPKEISTLQQKLLADLDQACAKEKAALLKHLSETLGTSMGLKEDTVCSPENRALIHRAYMNQSSALEIPKNFSLAFCRDYLNGEVLAFQMQLVETTPKKFSERHSSEKYGSIHRVTLDPVLAKRPSAVGMK